MTKGSMTNNKIFRKVLRVMIPATR